MLWGLVVVGVIGILLGFRFRAAALIIMTAVTVVGGVVAGGIGSVFDWHHLISILLLVVVLQGAYLLGLFLGVVWRQGMSREQ
ncbi:MULTISPECIES: hypothetical protein [unclassified Mesorhizobium]|uniref:hypothetical protein n=1 Tax=unclassified Mesorhizobium TaxID=325217 RepID=UPI000FCA3370|nr:MULTISPECIES: hypothetical protein [unclassified Mesorhizobium]RUX04323.1 hypothetical protein EOA35_10405 [Mesorhizobium sp. M8A.F.Ca.ET.023.01.1.1]TGR36975.1 hypothetical protein EN842_52030 [bacterium M00.F.Ca.ET.199.01.1.1]TGU18090.1 hypothetical protein EN799_61765 [bacterium M00.F.Ca.ET.156.01.1.1]TGU99897.1 hypothetical protein EN794_004120 [Mesorhizobium sp. M00.F.Ca.ET.151.01.1.1]TGV51150.1 hypothetical protein EN784_51445 [bacterium M00.F.Ca.ET.141.01.1.1]TGV82153.1 hypothetical 